ncbi:MAG: ATP-dependent Clp protease adaptor ClpS [Synechococcaceae bacterium WB8_1B_057]|nr:ATP-dependent Clp protease adaptor ClpS [Synechococcaceae bacterium WB6_1A_059]NDG79575.1 ATP-dependent Clp protease adaptor ClpS [Synechococcaceae bacterium WB8_1B_057]
MTNEVVLDKKSKTFDSLKLPKKYKVVILNDDQTPMEFVIALLMQIFFHSESAAHEITLKIHNEGSAVAGIYSFEIAEQKSIDSISLARANGFPLQTKIESE